MQKDYFDEAMKGVHVLVVIAYLPMLFLLYICYQEFAPLFQQMFNLLKL